MARSTIMYMQMLKTFKRKALPSLRHLRTAVGERMRSEAGLVRGERLLATLDRDSRTYIDDVVRWALAQSFGSLVKSIYEAYPEMKENSIFQG